MPADSHRQGRGQTRPSEDTDSAVVLFYVPVRDEAEGRRLAHGLLAEKAIACANLLPRCLSFYCWKGETTATPEQLLLLKTVKARARAVEAYLERHHSYQIPCILRFAPDGANPAFGAWLQQQCGEPESHCQDSAHGVIDIPSA